jgi:hypothetical protein
LLLMTMPSAGWSIAARQRDSRFRIGMPLNAFIDAVKIRRE